MSRLGSGAGEPVRLPPAGRGQRIGLYGGSFDPAHAGHRHVALTALRRLRLDAVWVLVSPGNPLKDRSRLPAVEARLAGARTVFRHPRLRVTDVERRIGARFTVETLRYLVARRPDLRFVWIVGGDSWAGFDRWRGWTAIARLLPVAVVDRPGWSLRATAGRAAQTFRRARLGESASPGLAVRNPPVWLLLHGPRSELSSTAIRARSGRH